MDIIVREEDAAKIQRIVDRFSLGKVDKASVVHEIEEDIADREPVAREVPTKSRGQRIYEEAMGAPAGKEKNEPENPTAAKTEKSPPSEHSSERDDSRIDKGRAKGPEEREKPSVRKELERYKMEARKLQEAECDVPQSQKGKIAPKNGKTVHKQPKRRKSSKER